MDSELQELYRAAVELVGTARAARGTDTPYRTVQDRRLSNRGVTAEAARQLAAFLRSESESLTEAARALERAARRLEREGKGT